METKLSVSHIIKEGFALFNSKKYFFITIAFIGFLPSIVLYILGLFAFSNFLIDLPFSLLYIAMSFWMPLALFKAAASSLHKQDATIKECYFSSANKIIPTFIISFLIGLLVGLGILLFLLPGLYLATIFSFSVILILLNDCSLKEALVTSYKLVKKNFWVVFFLFVLAAIVSVFFELVLYYIIPAQIYAIIIALTRTIYYPLFACLHIVLFYKLQSVAATLPNSIRSSNKTTYKNKLRSCFVGCFSAVLITLLFCLLFWYGIKGFGLFLDTDQGKTLYTEVANVINVPVTIDDHIILEPSKGYLVTDYGYKNETVYKLIHHNKFGINIDIYSFDKLKLTNKDVDNIGTGTVLAKYFEHAYSKVVSKNMKKLTKIYKPKIRLINGKQWFDFRYSTKIEDSPSKERVSAYLYTIVDKRILMMRCSYIKDKNSIEKTWKEMEFERVLEKINLP